MRGRRAGRRVVPREGPVRRGRRWVAVVGWGNEPGAGRRGAGVHRGLSEREREGRSHWCAGARGTREWPLMVPLKFITADLSPPSEGSAGVSCGHGDKAPGTGVASTPNVCFHSFGGRQGKGQGASRASSLLRALYPIKRQLASPCHRTLREER